MLNVVASRFKCFKAPRVQLSRRGIHGDNGGEKGVFNTIWRAQLLWLMVTM